MSELLENFWKIQLILLQVVWVFVVFGFFNIPEDQL